ncbi:hypothetical protein EUA93_20880 [Nocardioides oleivorans]|uniref:ESX-1 secretion-associated protein n=1 Tax=Nocardioides oleivorans TaxID=273676 RepID=A0A4Q2RMF8_9ACTN|nr:hypothetical protein [Nocardioides oleivorans]RYB90010.1 hypothetical protein EUA93_20880 [Nocardioides oleivorans]
MSDPGDVGQGSDFGADLYELLRTGWVDFPALSLRWWEFATDADVADAQVRANAGRLGGAGDRLVSDMVDLGVDLQRALGDTTTSLRDTGTALVQIAQDYAATDAAAQAQFDHLRLDDADEFATPPVVVPDPPVPGGDRS